MNPQQLQHYRKLRSFGLASRHALTCSRERLALESKCAATSFAWRENRQGLPCARWREE